MQKIIDRPDLKIYCSEINEPWKQDKVSEYLSIMPAIIRERITAYKDLKSVQSRIEGKLLLKKIITDLGLDAVVSLNDIAFTSTNRPYIPGNFDFNISHSGDLVVCAGGLDMKIGIDTEQILALHNDYPFDHFTREEQDQIKSNPGPDEEFYRLWVRKEALSKALGDGVLTSYHKTDVRADRIIINEINFQFTDLEIKPGYKTALVIA